MDKLNELKCKILGVTDEGIPSVKNWINLSPSSGGFGGPVSLVMSNLNNIKLEYISIVRTESVHYQT